MKPNPDAPWRRRQQAAATKASMKKTWWQKVWASRTAWGVVGGALVWVLSNGVESLTNLRKLPSEVQSTYHMFQSWYYDDALWTGTWSSREEGSVEDFKLSEIPLKLTVTTERGKVFGEMFNRSVCGKLVAMAFVYRGGDRRVLYSFSATRSDKEPVITLSPIDDPRGLVPANARLEHRIEAEPGGNPVAASGQEEEHHDLKCAESPIEYLMRLRREGVLNFDGRERGDPAK